MSKTCPNSTGNWADHTVIIFLDYFRMTASPGVKEAEHDLQHVSVNVSSTAELDLSLVLVRPPKGRPTLFFRVLWFIFNIELNIL